MACPGHVDAATVLVVVLSLLACDSAPDPALPGPPGDGGALGRDGLVRVDAETDTDGGGDVGRRPEAGLDPEAGTGDVGESDGGGDASADAGHDAAADAGETLVDPMPIDDGPRAPPTRTVAVTGAAELLAAIAAAQPGDAIVLADGSYVLDANVTVPRGGTALRPIMVRASRPLGARLEMCSTEGFRVGEPYWFFEGLDLVGSCPERSDGSNEHAFHVTGRASFTVVRHSRLTNFKSAVKLNGAGSPLEWPDDFHAIDNVFRYTQALGGAVPHNQLNLDGGDRHVVRRNRFVDLVTPVSARRHASAIYIKMTARDFVVEQNLVVCQKRVTTVSTRRGIFSGDVGPTSPFCDGDCANLRGLYRNNIVLSCSGSGNVGGLFVDNEKDTVYVHNTVHDVPRNFRGAAPGSTVSLFANLLGRDFVLEVGAAAFVADVDNLRQDEIGAGAFFPAGDRGDFSLSAAGSPFVRGRVARRADAPYDFCGNLRGALTDIGAVDYGHPQAAACLARIRALHDEL